MSLHVDVVRDTSKVIDNVAVCVIRHNVQKSLRILNILLPGCPQGRDQLMLAHVSL